MRPPGGTGAFWLRPLLALAALAILATGLHAQEASAPGAKPTDDAVALPKDAVSITHHVIDRVGEPLAYTATAGSIDVVLKDSDASGRIFYVAYEQDDADTGVRPVTFVFNGGPGAASAYLHLLALGPRIAVLNDDGTLPPPPVRLADNPASWLAFTDLVFVDPVGTGYSRVLEDSAAETSRPNGKGSEADFWSLGRDLDALAEFVRLYLTQKMRWGSPKFLAGESYGGFRAAALPRRLASDSGVRLSGIVLISPVLEFSLQDTDSYRLLPWAVTLPAYAATAMHHGKADAVTSDLKLSAALAKVESFAMSDYMAWLASGGESLDGDPEASFAALVRHLGLPAELVERYNGRVPRRVFAKSLLRDSQRVVSLYDGTVTGIDPQPSNPVASGPDPVLARLTAPLHAAFNIYVRKELRFETEIPYLVLNDAVHRNWKWRSEKARGQGFAGVGDGLKKAMSLDRELSVFVAHGYYDLVTPYLASRYVLRQMALDPEIQSNVVLTLYDGGHMPYTHASARAALHRDARAFFESASARPN